MRRRRGGFTHISWNRARALASERLPDSSVVGGAGFPVEEGRIVRIAETIDQYTTVHRLGNVVWPSYPIVFAENLDELADEIDRRGLFLFDIWGYVPGSGPGAHLSNGKE